MKMMRFTVCLYICELNDLDLHQMLIVKKLPQKVRNLQIHFFI